MRGLRAAVGMLVLLCAAAPSAATGVGEWAPDFTADALRGDAPPLRLSDFHGKVVYLDFWASWCAACKVSLPLLEQLHHEFSAQGFEVIAVDVDENPADGIRFLRDVAVRYPVVRDPQGALARLYEVPAMPSSFIIGRDGAVRLVHQGFRQADFAQLRETIAGLIGEK